MSVSRDEVKRLGGIMVAWIVAQMAMREWVREIEADMVYHDPDGMR